MQIKKLNAIEKGAWKEIISLSITLVLVALERLNMKVIAVQGAHLIGRFHDKDELYMKVPKDLKPCMIRDGFQAQ
jgi:hypothetical protein